MYITVHLISGLSPGKETGCLLSTTVQCATARLGYVLGGLISGIGPGSNQGWGAKLGKRIQALCYRINILGSQLSPSSINFVPVQAGKVTVDLASHWPCVTDNSGITTYGLTALGREMSTPPTLQLAHFTFYQATYLDCTESYFRPPAELHISLHKTAGWVY